MKFFLIQINVNYIIHRYLLPFFPTTFLKLGNLCSPIYFLIETFLKITADPQACFELGGGMSEMTLRIPLGTQCGTVQQV